MRREKSLGGLYKHVSGMLNIKFTLSIGGGLARNIWHMTEIATFTVKSHHIYFWTLCNIFGLNQVVDHPTHIHNGLCHSVIDLVFMSNLSYLSNCQVISPLSNSDHLGIKIKVKTKQTFRLRVPQAQRKICRYSFADWD